MDIYLTDLETNNSLRFPTLPESINVSIANQFASYQILGIGEIRVPGGVALDLISWDGVFFGEHRKNHPLVLAWVNPQEAFKWLENCKAKAGQKKKLRLLITETAINVDVYLESFGKTYTGGHGDIQYHISLVQAKDLKVMATSSTVATSPTVTLDTATTEDERPAPPEPTTYTVVKGDSLWAIAQKLLGDGSRYPELYEANSGTIDSKNSTSGNSKYTIYPGQVFTLPS